jgi:F-type H+-transporting ATPase subunit b
MYCTLGVFLAMSSFALADNGQAASVEAERDHAAVESHDAAAHEHHEIGHPPEGSSAYLPNDVKGDLALWTFVVFLILLGVLWKFAWGPIVAGLDKREQSIHDHIAAAERSHDEAKALLADYERKLTSAAEEVRGMLEEARRDAESTKLQILAEAKAGAEAERQRALRDVEAATDAALKQIAEQGANLAVDLAGKILGAKLNAADHDRLIADAVAKFPTMAPSSN